MSVPSITPIDSRQQAEVVRHTNCLIASAAELFGRRLDIVPIRFNLTGRSAGMFRVRDFEPEIRYNPHIFGRYFESNLSQTVPHEVAHYVVYQHFGTRGIKPHGLEWQRVMRAFGCEPKVRCDYDLTGMPMQRTRRYLYECRCREHTVSSVRHNRMRKHTALYYCPKCKHQLSHLKEIEL